MQFKYIFVIFAALSFMASAFADQTFRVNSGKSPCDGHKHYVLLIASNQIPISGIPGGPGGFANPEDVLSEEVDFCSSLGYVPSGGVAISQCGNGNNCTLYEQAMVLQSVPH